MGAARITLVAVIAIIAVSASLAGMGATGDGPGEDGGGGEDGGDGAAHETLEPPEGDAAAIRLRLDTLKTAIDAVSAQRDDLDRNLSDTIAELSRAINDANDAATALDILGSRRDETEARIETLTAREAALRQDLRTHTRSIEHLTSPMLAAARAPVSPSVTAAADPLAAARSTIVARRVMNDIERDMAVLRTEIDDLTRLDAMLQDEWTSLAEDSQTEIDRLADLESAVEEKKTVVAALIDARATQTGRLDSLAALTDSLETTIGALEIEARRLRDAHDQRSIIGRAVSRPAFQDSARHGGLDSLQSTRDPADNPWPEIAVPDGPALSTDPNTARHPDESPETEQQLSAFAEAGIRPPAAGRIVAAFGDPDRFGEPLPGMRFTVDPETPIVAPLGGTVKFAGSFGGYGRLLILEHGEGYHSLIAGFAEITVDPGQVVTRGMTLGRAPPPQNGQMQGPEIYFEVRQDGHPVAPLEGLSRAQERGRG